jgi:YegS/Rv2252/BmrU family lipid kinase
VAAHGLEAEIFLTERQGHARELARAAQARGVRTVVAWGGDGTVNEVASALVHTGALLAIVPAGSGNGLARELGIPCDPERALAIALGLAERVMDAGELDGRLFFNVAGLGLDARIAHGFAETGARARGFRRYAAVTLRELTRYTPEEYEIAVDGERFRVRAMLVAIANARQYGNGALIAPGARIDDGRLDVVAIGARSLARALLQIPRLFRGEIERVRGVDIRRGAHVEIVGAGPLLYHVDGEPHRGGSAVTARVHPGALRVRVPSAERG